MDRRIIAFLEGIGSVLGIWSNRRRFEQPRILSDAEAMAADREALRKDVAAIGLDAFFGKWPGDESDEQLAEMMRKLS